VAEKLGALTWETNEGVAHDGAAGFALRQWEQGAAGLADIIIQWEPQREPLAANDVYYAYAYYRQQLAKLSNASHDKRTSTL
jgi:hypothetical protein